MPPEESRPGDMPEAAVEVRAVTLDEIVDLRSRVLRSHMPGVRAVDASDAAPGTWHRGAFRDGRLVGVISGFSQEERDHPSVPAQRFRFMAVEPDSQGTGVGRALIAEAVAIARDAGARLLWANGRDSALGFYRGLGFEVVGDSFDDSTSGLPHHVVILGL